MHPAPQVKRKSLLGLSMAVQETSQVPVPKNSAQFSFSVDEVGVPVLNLEVDCVDSSQHVLRLRIWFGFREDHDPIR